jgi:hypothetical protein
VIIHQYDANQIRAHAVMWDARDNNARATRRLHGS